MRRQSRPPIQVDPPESVAGVRELGGVAERGGPKKVGKAKDRRAWAAMLYPSGVGDVFGALRGSPRLHWTPRAACAEAQDWIASMRIGPITWESVDDQVIIGRVPTHRVVIRSILLPSGEPPSSDDETADPGGPSFARREE
jgi:hypothetical protein